MSITLYNKKRSVKENIQITYVLKRIQDLEVFSIKTRNLLLFVLKKGCIIIPSMGLSDP